MTQTLGPDGHPIPEAQGVVEARIEKIDLRDRKPAGEGTAHAVGVALDANGKVIE